MSDLFVFFYLDELIIVVKETSSKQAIYPLARYNVLVSWGKDRKKERGERREKRGEWVSGSVGELASPIGGWVSLPRRAG
ncbi:MAG TPA: hypothetical protein PLT99_07610, partial [Chitinophagales bacterium]|nr:hypothetical protein [Chitinophagales bacterium]